MIEKGYEWDATLMPVSSVGAMGSRDFEKQVMPLCKAKQIAVLGMKGFGGSSRAELHAQTSIEKVLQYSLSYPQLCTQIVGFDKADYVDQAVTASITKPFTPEQREAYAANLNFEPGSAQYLAQHQAGALNDAGGCCVRRDPHNG
jgi:aryl-alcohol dehydrogenase-like predicted oxidoreductase